MSTAEAIVPTPIGLRQRRFTVAEYHRLADAGILKSGERCELIHGYIVEKPVIHPPHATAVRLVQKALTRRFGVDAVLRVQLPITLSDSEPEPDIVYAVGSDDDYRDRHPGPADCVLVIEVSDSTLHEDRTTKLALYAAEKVPQYWIVNLPESRVEVYARPRGGKSPKYQARTDYPRGTTVPVAAGGRVLGTIGVDDLLAEPRKD